MEDRHRFLDSTMPEPGEPERQFTALGHAGSEHYLGLETFDNPGCVLVTYESDEVTAHCPITGQPDFYTARITLAGTEKLIESKSLKLWLRQFSDPSGPGLFCESLAVFIRKQIAEVVGLDEEDGEKQVEVQLLQKSRGGISIKAVA